MLKKMLAFYGYLGVVFLIYLVLWGLKHKEPTLLSGLKFLATIIFANFSNYIYQQKAIKTVERLTVEIPNEEERHTYLRKKGGVSSGSVWLFVLISAIIGGIEAFSGIIYGLVI